MVILQMEFSVAPANIATFCEMYRDVYHPILSQQAGFQWSTLQTVFPPEAAAEIGAHPTEFNIQMQLCFETEQQRSEWASSDDHAEPWRLATTISDAHRWIAYDTVD